MKKAKDRNLFSFDDVFYTVLDVIDEQLKRVYKQAEQVQNIICEHIPNGNEDEQREHEERKNDFYYCFDCSEKYGHENREFFLVSEIVKIVKNEFYPKAIIDKTKENLIDILTNREDF